MAADDVKAVAPMVLPHRLMLTGDALLADVTEMRRGGAHPRAGAGAAMNLRQNGLMLLLATALLGIAAQWAGMPAMANLWALPLGLLLLGLAYERWVLRAAPRCA